MRFSLLFSSAFAGFYISSVHSQRPSFAIPRSADILPYKSTVFTANQTVDTTTRTLPKAYVVQLEHNSVLKRTSGQDPHAQFHKRASTSINYSVRHVFQNPSLFFGLSIQVKDGSDASDLLAIPNVVAVWPVYMIARPDASPPTGIYNVSGPVYTPSATAGAKANINSIHEMTEVDRLHELGIKGKRFRSVRWPLYLPSN